VEFVAFVAKVFADVDGRLAGLGQDDPPRVVVVQPLPHPLQELVRLRQILAIRALFLDCRVRVVSCRVRVRSCVCDWLKRKRKEKEKER
jgi:hypothetical protein